MVQTARTDETFTEFVKAVEPRLAYALGSAYGAETGKEATADALAYAWENWEKVGVMDNPAGYLFRVGQSRARRYFPRPVHFPTVPPEELPHVEPGLPKALASLSRKQRVAVVLIHGQGYTERETAELMGLARGTVRQHADRGLAKLRVVLEVKLDD